MRSYDRGVVIFAVLVFAISCDSSVNPTIVEQNPPVGKISVDTKAISLIVGEERQLSVSTPSSQATWQSDNPSVVTVSSTGLVLARTPGIAHAVVRSKAAADTATITVRGPVARVRITADSINIAASQKATLSFRAFDALDSLIDNQALVGSTIRWTSTLPAIVTVDSTGMVTALAIGRAGIALDIDGKVDTSIVNVVATTTPGPAPIATIALVLSSSTLSIGQSVQAIATPRDSAGNALTGRSIVWTSANASIVAVSASGLVTAIGSGAAAITATAEGKSASATVTVAAVASPATIATIGVSLGAPSMLVGQTTQATATPRDAAGNMLTGRTFSWTSSNPGVAAVSTSGLVTALASGTATVTASSQGAMGGAVATVAAVATPAIGTLVSHDFEDGTLGPYWNPWGTAIDVVDDPTGGGHGKVARIHYAAASADDNKALSPKTGFGIGLGDSVWFRGDFYLPADVNDQPVVSMRKLNYWGSINDGFHFKENFGMVLTLQGAQLEVANTAVGPSNLPTDYTYTPVFVTKGQWHTLEVQLRVNSSFAAQDGVLRIWLDGAIVYDRTNMRWTDPLWTEDPTTYKWEAWGMGYQMQSQSPYDEYRYWDNMTFAKTRVQP